MVGILAVEMFLTKSGDILVNEIEKCKTNKGIRQVGIDWAINQSKELIASGVPVVHYYSMGKSDNIKKIASEVF